MKKKYSLLLLVLTVLILTTLLLLKKANRQNGGTNAGLILPQGFNAVKLIEGIGKVRHIVITQNGYIYARLARPVKGQGTLLLQVNDDTAIVKIGFGNYGGTGVRLYNGYLYTASNSAIFRYKVDGNEQVIDTNARETIVTGLLDQGTHETKSIMMDNAGNMYIPIGCPLNSCQQEDRKRGSMGIPDCPLLAISGGVWQFKPDKLNQGYADGVRYATGLRNVVAIDWNTQTNQLYVMQHGRDQLDNIFPDMFTAKQNAETPAECMYALKHGDNAGWPFIYYDRLQNKRIQMPEYGGDGKKEGSSAYINPVAAYPAHMAPNDILFYTGNQFPARYKNGAFIAFHGSWNRRPEPQAGYCVVFQPFKNGKPFGDWEVFADGFSGSPEKTASGKADHRPCGLAQGPDGALYVSDDSKGAIYKINYGQGLTKKSTTAPVQVKATPVEPIYKIPDAIKDSYSAGAKVYTQNCAGCHRDDGGGVPDLNAPLINTSTVLGDKTILINVLLKGEKGVEVNGEKYSNAMPSHSFLTDQQIADVLTYLRNSFGNKATTITSAEVAAVRNRK